MDDIFFGLLGRLDKYAKQAKVIHLDIDPAEIDKNVKTTVPVWGNCKKTIPMLTELLKEANHSDWLNKFRELEKEEIKEVIQDELNPTSEVMTMGEVIKTLNEITNGDAIITTDVGQHQMVACRYASYRDWETDRKSTRLNSNHRSLSRMPSSA